MSRSLAALAAVFCFSAFAEQSVDNRQLQDADWKVRASALSRILANPSLLKRADTKDALIACLEREDKVIASLSPESAEANDEGYGDTYLSSLTNAVMEIAQSSNNKRAFDALVRSSYNADSVFGRIVASHFEELPVLMDVAKQGPGRSDAVLLIGTMLRNSKDGKIGSVNSESYRQAKRMLTNAATSPTEAVIVRQAAVAALARVGDPEDVTVLQQIAVADPVTYEATPGKPEFLIRQEARKALQRLAPNPTGR